MNNANAQKDHDAGTHAALSKKEQTLKRAQADQAVKGQPTSGVDNARDEPAHDTVPKPHGQTNQTR
ncbi:hypothetical protein [Pseudorhodoferax sp.]|uniref:hypothetical protein n=1 Tax=Pseudorhodoferax sp. TaxID=1993553 RepID=UPI002DD64488|nr:hypothetical protein [Pseudorhodoferax sp.]